MRMTSIRVCECVIGLAMQARNVSSAMSAASSACDHIYNWVNGTPKDTWVSMGVYSDGSYNAPKVIACLQLCRLLHACV